MEHTCKQEVSIALLGQQQTAMLKSLEDIEKKIDAIDKKLEDKYATKEEVNTIKSGFWRFVKTTVGTLIVGAITGIIYLIKKFGGQ